MRINQFLAHYLGISRREVDGLIAQHRVRINDNEAVMGSIVSENDRVQVQYTDKPAVIYTYSFPPAIAVYKPPFCFAVGHNQADPDKKNIYDILPKMYTDYLIVGRLEYMAEGVVVLKRSSQTHNIEQESQTIPLTPSTKTNTDLYIIISDDMERVKMVLSADASIENIVYGLPEEFGWINVPQNVQHSDDVYVTSRVCAVTKIRTRRSLLRVLQEQGIGVQRYMRVRDGDVVLTQELYEKGFLPLM